MIAASLLRLKWPAAGVGALAGVVWALGAFAAVGEVAFRAYLFAYLFFLGLSLGGLCLLMLHNLTGGDWGWRVRLVARAASLLLPWMAVLFLPLLFGLHSLYPWADAEKTEELLRHREPYLNVPFFMVRAGLYFLAWTVLAFLMNRPLRAVRGWSAAGLILYLLTKTHAGIDWLMSRDVEFYSTTFGFILTVGQTLGALAFAVAMTPMVTAPLPLKAHGDGHPRTGPNLPLLNDLGNLLLTLVILWAYVSFMQLLVIWMGNSTEDNTWYLERGLGGGGDSWAWRVVGLVLVMFHFFVPFYVLLFRGAKQRRGSLTGIAWMLLLAHIVEAYWLVAPSGHAGSAVFDPHWLDAAAFVAVGGLWLGAFLWVLPRVELRNEPPWSAPEGVMAHE